MSAPADDAGKQVASGGEEEELNDRVEDLDGTEEEQKQGPQENSAEKNNSSAKRRTRAPADNLTPAQR